MHSKTAIKKVLKIENVIIKNVYFETEKEEEIFVVQFGLYSRDKERCPHCGRKCKKYDNGKGMRRWRSLDFGVTKVFIEAEMPRIKCPVHGVIAQRVPWARHKSDFTKDFEQAVTWFCLLKFRSLKIPTNRHKQRIKRLNNSLFYNENYKNQYLLFNEIIMIFVFLKV